MWVRNQIDLICMEQMQKEHFKKYKQIFWLHLFSKDICFISKRKQINGYPVEIRTLEDTTSGSAERQTDNRGNLGGCDKLYEIVSLRLVLKNNELSSMGHSFRSIRIINTLITINCFALESQGIDRMLIM